MAEGFPAVSSLSFYLSNAAILREQDGTRMSRLILVCETAQFAQKTDGNGTPVATASGRNGNCAVDCDIPF